MPNQPDGDNADVSTPAESSAPVVTLLRCPVTGRTLAYDVSPADGSLQLLVEVLAQGWPIIAHVPTGTEKKRPSSGPTSRGNTASKG
jgi:hypothetical protein